MTTKLLLAVLLLALCGCADAPVRDSGPGTVREAFWENTGRIAITFEFQDGKTVLWQSCGKVPLWKGEQVRNVRYQWRGGMQQCLDIYEVVR